MLGKMERNVSKPVKKMIVDTNVRIPVLQSLSVDNWKMALIVLLHCVWMFFTAQISFVYTELQRDI